MAEHGIHDFLLAKRKAAERFGVTDQAALPRNTEIEEALAEHQRLFGGASHETNLRELRQTALKAMRLLQAFEPRLVGPVLTGSAGLHDDVQLHVFADRAEAVQFALMDRQARYESMQRRMRLQAGREPVIVPGLRFSLDGIVVEVLVFGPEGLRQAPVSVVDGKPMRRADSSDVMALLAEIPVPGIRL